MKQYPSFIFCGFMGSGKSKMGTMIAKKAGINFYDLDTLIEERAKTSIPTIFQEKGEEYFRKMEEDLLFDFLMNARKKGKSYIFSLGGGALKDVARINHIKEYASLVYIKVPFDSLYQRLIRRKTRPLLLDENGEIKPHKELYPFLESLYKKRLPLYDMANITFNQDPESSKEDNASRLFNQLYT